MTAVFPPPHEFPVWEPDDRAVRDELIEWCGTRSNEQLFDMFIATMRELTSRGWTWHGPDESQDSLVERMHAFCRRPS